MPRTLDQLSRGLARWAVPNLTLWLIAGQALVYATDAARPQAPGAAVERVLLVPGLVLQGEVWRVVTFLLTPPPTNVVFAFFAWSLFYMMGTTLEAAWGAPRYNLYLLTGWLASVAAAFLTPNALATNLFLEASVLLAFARLNPDFQIQLMFILPVKVKWLAWLTWGVFVMQVVQGPWGVRAMALAAVLNYLLFFSREHWRDLRDARRRSAYRARATPASLRMRHQCRVCGRSSSDEPRVPFRYCTRCAGQQCYCPDHLNAHEHVTEGAQAARR